MPHLPRSWPWIAGIIGAFFAGAVGGGTSSTAQPDPSPSTVTVTVRVPVPAPTSKPAPKPKPKPTPKPTPAVTAAPPSLLIDPQFSTCAEAKRHGYGPYVDGIDREYDWYIDRDSDGIVCE
jgi:hypothetical protein